MEIKPFNFSKIENVAQLLGNCTPYVLPHHPYIYWIMIEYFQSLCFTAHVDDKVIGFICALHSSEKNTVFIWQLAVNDNYRRTGTARLLCEKIIKYTEENNIRSLQFTISDKNNASISFFSRLAKYYDKSIEEITLDGLGIFENEFCL